MHIGIIGAGIVGISTAHALAEKGFRVTIIDSNAKPGLETSFANGAQLSYSYVSPLASPSVFTDLPKWILKKDSPLRFIPRFSVRQWKWLVGFLQACNTKTAKHTTEALLALSYHSRDVLNELTRQYQLAFEQKVNGKLIIYRNSSAFEKAKKQAELQYQLGGTLQQVLSAQATLQQEPSLEAIRDHLAGSIYTEDEACGDCFLFIQELTKLLERRSNVEWALSTTVQGFRLQDQQVCALQTSRGELECDAVVVANATGSVPLLQPLGYTPLVYPLKGYSLSLSNTYYHQENVPHASVTDYDKRIVYAPLASQLRIAAMVDIGDTTTALNPNRLSTLKQQVAEVFPSLDLEKATPWAGLRPATPTGLPIISKHPRVKNVWLNIGHGALGQTLASGSASVLSHMIAQEPLSIDVGAFKAL